MQKVVMKGGYSYATATEIAIALIDRGFSVSSEEKDGEWTISGLKAIDPELERKANDILERAGIVPSNASFSLGAEAAGLSDSAASDS